MLPIVMWTISSLHIPTLTTSDLHRITHFIKQNYTLVLLPVGGIYIPIACHCHRGRDHVAFGQLELAVVKHRNWAFLKVLCQVIKQSLHYVVILFFCTKSRNTPYTSDFEGLPCAPSRSQTFRRIFSSRTRMVSRRRRLGSNSGTRCSSITTR